MPLRIKISQVGLPAGTPGVSRTDGLATGALVTLEDVEGTGNSSFHLLWGPPADTNSLASLAPSVDPDIWTFTPTAGLYDTFLIELREHGVPVERRIFGIRTPNQHLLIPALNERASRHASWDNDGTDEIELSENNAVDFPDTSLNAYAYAGWWRSLRELYAVVEAGTGGIADHAIALVKLELAPALSLIANPANASGDAQYVSATFPLQYFRSNAAGTALEWSDLSDHGSASILYNPATKKFERAAVTGVVTAGQNSNSSSFSAAAAKSALLNATNASAAPTYVAGSAAFQYLRVNSTNTGLEWATLAAQASTSLIYDGATNSFQRAALTGAVTSGQNSNATAFGSAAAKSVLANATNASAVPAFLAGSAAFQHLRVNGTNNGLEFATLSGYASATISYTSDTFVVNQTANYTWSGNHTFNGSHVLAERGAAPTVTAGQGAFWVQSTTPSTPQFVDDIGANWPLAPSVVASMAALQSQTASTTAINGTTFTVPGGSFRVGTLYEIEGYIVVRRGATATAANLNINLTLNGSVYATVSIPIFVTTNAALQILVRGYLLCLTTGSGGTFIGNLMLPNNVADLSTFNAANTLALLASSSNDAANVTTQNTANPLVIGCDAGMSAAVSALKFTWTACVIKRMQP